MQAFFAQAGTDALTKTLHAVNDTNAWSSLTPEIGIALLAVLTLVFEMILPKSLRNVIPNLALIGIAALIGGLIPSLCHTSQAEYEPIFGGLIYQTEGLFAGVLPSTTLLRVFFLTAAFFVIFLGARYLKKRDLPVTEFLHIVLVVTGALMLLVQSNNFVMLFVALETITVGFYILVGYNRKSNASLEAGVKYLVMGGLSSALLLFGIVLLYGVAGNPELNKEIAAAGIDAMNFDVLKDFIAAHPTNPLVLAGISLVIGGIAFKIGAFPFQIWVPDVYQGAPTPTTAFLAVASKAAGIFTLMLLISGPFISLVVSSNGARPLYWLLAAVTGMTLIFSNITALGQTNTKRLMGLSGVSHAGFLLLAILAAAQPNANNGLAASAIIIYLIAYLAGAIATFGVMAEMPGLDDSTQSSSDYQLLVKRSPFLAGILGCSVGSLAGIPPSLGFVAKFLVIVAALQAQLYCLAAIALLCVGAGVYYYFAWLREAFQRTWISEERAKELSTPIEVSVPSRIVLATLATIILIGGIVQSFLQILL
ncbi:MAG: NADH-quinone oxidoreductase subunit N [Puniceicoccales bacterium]|jgi:NADH-quinone oxidoreductase subunit N|nr:NADH-quinone oxidoreductase subunit N [Puniceicoccales bacterium]